MWNKLSTAFNSKNSSRSSFGDDDDVPNPSASARVLAKENERAPSPFRIAKKVKSSLHINTHSSQNSLHRTSDDSAFRPSLDKTPTTPAFNTEREHPNRFGSLRSILRDRNAPGSGSNVRFFSRDAYKTISPNGSQPSTEPEDISFLSRLQLNGKNTAPGRSESVRPSARDVFASLTEATEEPSSPTNSHTINSMMSPVPPPDMSNIFDMSQEHEIPTIAPVHSSLLDNAIELNDYPMEDSASMTASSMDEDITASTPTRQPGQETAFFSPDEVDTPASERSRSFAFGHPVFHAPSLRSESPAPSLISDKRSSKSSSTRSSDSPTVQKISKSRSRALSDTVFQSMIRSGSTPPKDTTSESENKEPSDALLVYSSQPPDPFCANASTYYTPGGIMPPTPPQPTHMRKASKEEDMIWSLRTQLALQQDLCAQYEIDLGARDELVNALNEKLDLSEKERQHRSGVLRGWKKKVQELERVCRGLEEQVDKSRQDSMERSIVDEASGEALRELHRVIGRLEKEKAQNEEKAKEERAARDVEIETLKVEIEERIATETQLREEMSNTNSEGAASEEEKQRYRLAEAAWAEERADLEKAYTDKDAEFDVLKKELEAQWKNTETMSEKISELERERNFYKADVEHLEKRLTDMEVDWNDYENRRVGQEAEFQQMISEKSELEEQLGAEREQVQALTQALRQSQEAFAELQSEREQVLDNVTRLEETVHQQEAEVAQFSKAILEREVEVEELREVLNNVQVERSLVSDEQSRNLQEVTVREGEVRMRMESLLTEKADRDANLETLREQFTAMTGELEKLQKHVHDLQQESADKEVRLSQLAKRRDQDKEDIQGLNIALDSKQQELELLKRKIGVRGTAGSTPAPAPKRRESSMFATPTVIRPPSALSDAGKDANKKETIASRALTKSVRTNGTSPSTTPKPRVEGAMGPPPSAARRISVTGSTLRVASGPQPRISSGSTSISASKAPVISRRASSDLQSSAIRTKPSVVAAAARGSSAVLREREEKENSKPSATPRAAPKRTPLAA